MHPGSSSTCVINIYKPWFFAMGIERVIGVGRYAQKQAAALFDDIEVDWVPHPSPASPFANRNGGADWRAAFKQKLGI